MGEGKEGDWECKECKNRNYGFRSLCNRCKQPRHLVDNNSNWLPRIGDWICLGCTNNNYASRDKCKKCGQPKEVAAAPAIAMQGSNFFDRAQGLVADQRTNTSLSANETMPPQAPFTNWSLGGTDKYRIQQTPYYKHDVASNLTNEFLVDPKGWRNGDWACSCGFHNYASRTECNKCNASMPPALGTKRLASEEINAFDCKRPNFGPPFGLQQAYPLLNQPTGSYGNPSTGLYLPSPYFTNQSLSIVPHLQINGQFPSAGATPPLLGKGAKQWRDGDWMCTKCDNHNYASRSQCNRCKTEKGGPAQPVGVS